jgi:hypothetical protein
MSEGVVVGQASGSLVERINGSIEKGFQSCGRVIVTRSRLLLAVCLLMIFFAFGLLMMDSSSDSYHLWVDKDSRLLVERQFKADVSHSIISLCSNQSNAKPKVIYRK